MASRECYEDQQSDMSSSIEHRTKLLQELQEEVMKDPSFMNKVNAILSTTSTDDGRNDTHSNKTPICLLSEHQCCNGSSYVSGMQFFEHPPFVHPLSQAKKNAEEQEPSMAAKTHDFDEESNLSTTDSGVNKMSEMENNFELMKPVIKDSTLSNSSTSINEFKKTGDSTTEEYGDESITYCSDYDMNHPRRGYALIFSHKNFLEHLNLNERDNADIDAQKLLHTFRRFNFTTEVYMDKKYHEIIEILSNLAGQDHHEEDCLVIAISTSGEKGFLMAADKPYNPENLWTPFIGNKCPSLAGKPKLFFIEASKGDKFDRGIDVPSRMVSDSGHSIHTERYHIPSYADLIIMNSYVEGFCSWRKRLDGAWFITALSDVLLQSDGSEDLLTLLHQVSGKVALEYESLSLDSNTSRCKQVPSIRSTLTRKIYLKPEVPEGQQLTETDQISEYKEFSAEFSRIHHKLARYNMDHCERGFAIIFDHEVFESHNLQKRVGSNLDASSLQKVFLMFNFKTQIYSNLKSYEIHHVLLDLAQMDHSDEDCLIVVVLTHGLKAGVLYGADNPYPEEMLWSPFLGENCPSLAGKPKIFLIQACRGMEFDPGVALKTKAVRDSDSSISYRIPSHADFLIVHSTFEGFASWRNTTAGSWFIKSFYAEMMRQNEKFRFIDVLTRVCQRAAIDFESNTPHLPLQHAMMQIPSIYSTLTRDFIFSRELALTAPVEESSASDSVGVKNEYLIKEITSTLEPQTSRFSINIRWEYSMNSTKRGRAIIFNHKTYYFNQAGERKGTEKDVEKLEEVLRCLGFELIIKNNPEFSEIVATLDEEVKLDHSDTDCLVVFVLTHGCKHDDDVIWASDVTYYADDLWKPFMKENCSLQGKPKMFFIQACRGDRIDSGMILQKKEKYSGGSNPGKDPKKDEKDLLSHIPNGCLPSDTLVFFSCSLDFVSYRNPETGTCFIQSLADELSKSYESLDLVKILTRTSRRVALDFESQDGDKQMPVLRSTLRAKVYFRSKKEIL
ncbi:uncharacterized protein [Anabrus simplex]|uniref:uncharacterized protein n=1 Tax=Anabrus simplex TaxID=316456 RepID=UPI0035A2CB2A